jgi:hypothetical protein
MEVQWRSEVPIPGIMPASHVGVKDRRTHPWVENGIYSPILHPYVSNQPNPPSWKCFFDDVFNSLSSFPFEIQMVITQSLYDEGIKNSGNIDGISLILFLFRA